MHRPSWSEELLQCSLVKANEKRSPLSDYRRTEISRGAAKVIGHRLAGLQRPQGLPPGDDDLIDFLEQGSNLGLCQRGLLGHPLFLDRGLGLFQHLTGAAAAGSTRAEIKKID